MPTIPFSTDSRFIEQVCKHVLQYARKHYGSLGLPVEDLVQEALLTVHENVQNGKLTKLTCSLQTYVIGIFRNKFNEALREQKKIATIPQQSGQDDDDGSDLVDMATVQDVLARWMHADEEDEHERLLEAAHDIVVNLQEPCKTILWAFYWEDNSMGEIANILEYNNARVATTQKSRCMTKVKTALEETFKRLKS